MSELSIKVSVAGRVYPLSITLEEEENIRQAAKQIDENIQMLQSNYAVKDKQDLLAMTALQMATEKLNISQQMDKEVVKQLKQLNDRLDVLLKG